jgi:outer membrane protein OmpA-like peptidoglycan-associated protein
MTGQPPERGREPVDGVARIWQLYADEIGLPDASSAARTVPTRPPDNVTPSTPPQRLTGPMRVRVGVAAVAVVVAVVLVTELGPQLRTLLDSQAQRTSSTDPRPAERADSGPIQAAPTPLRSDGRSTVPLSVGAPAEATHRDRVDQHVQAAGSASTSAARPVVIPKTGAAQTSKTPPGGQKPRPILPYRIIFDFDSDVLTEDSRRTLENVAAAMKANPDWRLMIAGHTDTYGAPAYNMALSERRAQAAKAYLESSGISGQRLRISGFAGSRPLANDRPLTFLNRRVEFHRW